MHSVPNEYIEALGVWAPCLPIACDNDVRHLPGCVFTPEGD